MTISCDGCGLEWTAQGQAHCKGSRSEPGCHQHFNSTAAFDRHRTGEFGKDRRCIPVSEFGNPVRRKDGSSGPPLLVKTSRNGVDVWVTALRDDRG